MSRVETAADWGKGRSCSGNIRTQRHPHRYPDTDLQALGRKAEEVIKDAQDITMELPSMEGALLHQEEGHFDYNNHLRTSC